MRKIDTIHGYTDPESLLVKFSISLALSSMALIQTTNSMRLRMLTSLHTGKSKRIEAMKCSLSLSSQFILKNETNQIAMRCVEGKYTTKTNDTLRDIKKPV